MKRNFAAVLFKNRFQPEGNVRHLLEKEAAAERQRIPGGKPKRNIRGIHRGQFFRVKVPGPSPPFRLPRLRNHANPMMRPFVKTEGHHRRDALSVEGALTAEHAREDFWDRARQWLKYNWGVLILNFGSICSLLAFTRSDVLELRSLAVSGSLSSLVYFATLPPEKGP